MREMGHYNGLLSPSSTMLVFRLLLGLIFLAGEDVFADQILEGYSVVRGKDYAFEIKAPRSWVLDNDAAKTQGISLVFILPAPIGKPAKQ